MKEDPRRSSDYRNQVVEGLGFGKDASEKRPGMSEQQVGFGLKSRTTVRNDVLHDCVLAAWV